MLLDPAMGSAQALWYMWYYTGDPKYRRWAESQDSCCEFTNHEFRKCDELLGSIRWKGRSFVN